MTNYAPARYGKVAQVFHWATALLVLAAFIFGPGGSEERIYSPARDFDRQLHETLGLCVFALVSPRSLWHRIDKHPESPQVARWMKVAATVVQWLLYLLLFAVPLTAIAGARLERHPLTSLAGVKIQPLVGKSRDAGKILASVHTWLGDTIIWLAGFHALASLYHHFVLKDGILESMLPHWFSVWRPHGE